MVNIFGPGHYANTNQVATRPTPIATLLNYDAWFGQCDANGEGGTNIDEMWLNLMLAALRSAVRSAGATQGELVDNMVSEAMSRYASGGIYCVDTGLSAGSHVLSTPLLFVMPKSLFEGMMVSYKPAHTNSGAVVVNAFGLGAKAARTYDDEACAGGEFSAGVPTWLMYSPAANGGDGAWLILPWALPSVSSNTPFRNMVSWSTSGTYTWTVPSGVTRVFCELVGAGGGGGVSNNNSYSGSSGAGGGYAAGFFNVTPGENITVIVGAAGTGRSPGETSDGGTGGTSSFGSHCSATGGRGGKYANGGPSPPAVQAGGAGAGGQIQIQGQSGQASNAPSTNSNYPAGGASPRFGGGGINGDVSTIPGSGGSPGFGSTAAGSGAPGAVILTW